MSSVHLSCQCGPSPTAERRLLQISRAVLPLFSVPLCDWVYFQMSTCTILVSAALLPHVESFFFYFCSCCPCIKLPHSLKQNSSSCSSSHVALVSSWLQTSVVHLLFPACEGTTHRIHCSAHDMSSGTTVV